MNIRHEQVAPYSYGYEVTFRSAGQGVSYRWECYCPLPEVAEQITHKIENAAPQVDISALLEGIALSERDKITSFVLESDSGLQRRGRYTGHVASAQDVHRGIALDGIILGHFQGDYSSMTTAKQNEAVRQEGLHTIGDPISSGRGQSLVDDFSSQIRTRETPAVLQRGRVNIFRQQTKLRPPSTQEEALFSRFEPVENPRQPHLDIKTKDSYILRQAPDSPEKVSRMPDMGSRMRAWYLQRRRSDKEIPQAFSQESGSKDAPGFRQTEELPQMPDQVSGRTVERPEANRRQGEREFMQEQGRQEAMRKEKLRLSKKDRVSPPQISGSGTPVSQVRDGTVPYAQQSPMTPSAQPQSNFAVTDAEVKRAVTKEVQNGASKGKSAIKTASAGIKSSRHPRQRTVKTAEHSAKAAQKAKAVAKARQRTMEAARATAKAGAITVKSAFSSAKKEAVKTAPSGQSRVPETGSLDCPNQAANDTEKKETEFIETNPILPQPPHTSRKPSRPQRTQAEWMDEMRWVREEIRENIDYEGLLLHHPCDQDIVDGYVELMTEAACSSKETFYICGQELPTTVVRNRFLKLEREHIEYVRDCLCNTTHPIRNIKAYTLASLFNAPVTIEQYYAALVSWDMA